MNIAATELEHRLILQIASRAIKSGLYKVGEMHSVVMDLVATHLNGNPLRLDELLVANDGDFAHDLGGIRSYLDRTTGQLTECWTPRFSR